MTIGEKIREARLKKSLTQQELGELVGVQKSAIAKYENGRIVNLKHDTIQSLSKILDIPPYELIMIDDPAEEVADIHARIALDYEMLDVLKKYYDLPSDDKELIISLINKLSNYHLTR